MRKREFDPDDALEKAMHLFWRQGYKNTSIRDLVAHTGVSHEGLYGAFGNKEQLFQAVLERYADLVGEEMYGPLNRPDTSLPDIKAFFAHLIQKSADPRFRNGCLACNAAVELASEVPAVAAGMRQHFDRMTELFQAVLERAKERGEIADSSDPAVLAEFLSATMNAMALMLRAKQTPAKIERFAETALSVLE